MADRLGGDVFRLPTAPWCGRKSLVALGPLQGSKRRKSVKKAHFETDRSRKGQTNETSCHTDTEGRRTPKLGELCRLVTSSGAPEFEGPGRFLSVSYAPSVTSPFIVDGD
jgi:hypothetical protein